MTLLAVTVDSRQFDPLLAAVPEAVQIRALMRRTAIEVAPAAADKLKGLLAAMFLFDQTVSTDALPAPSSLAMEASIYAALLDLLRSGSGEGKRVKGLSAHVLVSECHRLTMDRLDAPPTIEELCMRLRTSRRSLQGGFQAVAGTTPVNYLRCMRLNLVRRTLHRTLAAEASIGAIAARAGFTQLSHFAAEYKRLFAEVPSQTLRANQFGLSRPRPDDRPVGSRLVLPQDGQPVDCISPPSRT